MDGFISSFTISPDSKWLVYGVGYSDSDFVEMFSRRIDGTGEAVSLSGEEGSDDVYRFAISPDSQRVVFTGDPNGEGYVKLYARAIDGSDVPARLSKGGRGEVWAFVVSTNNHVLYFADDDKVGMTEVYLRSIDGPDTPVKLNGPLVKGGNIDWAKLSTMTGGLSIVRTRKEKALWSYIRSPG